MTSPSELRCSACGAPFDESEPIWVENVFGAVIKTSELGLCRMLARGFTAVRVVHQACAA